MDNIVEQLVKLRNEDETAWLETLKKILEYYFSTSPQGVKDTLYEEFNRLSKQIEGSSERQKKYT